MQSAMNNKGAKRVSDAEYDEICRLFKTKTKTEAKRLARKIVANRLDQGTYNSGHDLGLRNGKWLQAIALDGWSIVRTTPNEPGDNPEEVLNGR